MDIDRRLLLGALAIGVLTVSTALATAAAVNAAVSTPPTASALPAHARPAAKVAATRVMIVRPVTAGGTPTSGFHVATIRHALPIDCSFAEPSPGAVDRNIEFCSPSVSDAVACWKTAKGHHALCMQNPSSHRVYRLPLSGGFAKTAIAKPAGRAPLRIVLTDGTYCSIRDGDAWASLKSHPNWYGSYSCSRHGVVWTPRSGRHYGIDESKASWTVHIGAASGTGKLTVRHIARAYFVGTARG